MLDDKKKSEIIRSLMSKIGYSYECPICHNKQFTILDGYVVHGIQDDFHNLVIGGPLLPSVVLVCKNCGFMSQHNLGVLGLLDKTEDKEEQEDK